MERKEYVGYEYREISVEQQKASRYLDGLRNFGWETDENFQIVSEKGRTILHLKRDRKILNKTELTRLQNHFESDMREIEIMERNISRFAAALSIGVAVAGTVFMTGSTFAVTHHPPMIGLTVLLAIPGFAGWIAPAFLYKKIKTKKRRKMQPYLEQKFEELHQICQKGNSLLH